MRKGHIRRTLSLSNRLESPPPSPGAGHRKPPGGSQGEVSEANPRRLPGSIGTPPLSVANGQAALRQQEVGAAGGGREAAAEETGLRWLEERREQEGAAQPPEEQRRASDQHPLSRVRNSFMPQSGHILSTFPMMLYVHNGY
ncbi:Src Substrate Cortactin [Manis pentadactyla]|nr:Src Substrate Cortactin [Manis pentadactyla]